LHSKWRRWKLERNLELVFQNFESVIIYPFRCSFISKAQRTFVTLQLVCPMTKKWLNLANEWGKYWNVFNDKYMFYDGRFYPNLFPIARSDKSSMMLLACPISIWQVVCFLNWKSSYSYKAIFKIIINDRFLV
jgi:hypothetical protein